MNQFQASASAGAAFFGKLPSVEITTVNSKAKSSSRVQAPAPGLPDAWMALENLACGVVISDERGRIVYGNIEFGRLMNCPISDLVGLPLASFLADEKVLEDSDYSRATQIKSATAHRKGAAGIRVEISESIILEAGRAKTLSTFRRVSAREEFARLHHDFIAQVVHELKTPLSSITGVLCMLEEGVLAKLNTRGKGIVQQLKGTCKRMTRLIDDMLDIERMQAGKFRLDCKAVYLPALLARVIDGVMPIAGLRQITFDCAELSCWADEDRLIQVLINLLANAIKNSSDCGSIRMSAEAFGSGVKITVADNGCGIPEDKISKIFELFEQVDLLDAKLKGGSGLGLAICKAIVNEHGGEIGVSSVPGKGSSFWFSLPGCKS